MGRDLVVTRLDDGRDVILDKKRIAFDIMNIDEYSKIMSDFPVHRMSREELVRLYVDKFCLPLKLRKCSIIMSLKCNLECRYCYERSMTLDRESIFSPEKVDAALAFLADKCQLDGLVLHVSGGEPLLEENRSSLERILERATLEKCLVSITTNGKNLGSFYSLLSNYKNQIKTILVSVDGDEPTNFRSRGNPRTLFDHEEVICQCERFAETFHLSFNIVAPYQTSETILGIVNLTDRFQNHESVSFSVSDVIDISKDESEKTVYPEEKFRWYEELWSRLDDSVRRRISFDLPLYELFMSATNTVDAIPLPSPGCGIVRNSLLFFPDGSIYPCERFMQKPDSLLGTFFPESRTNSFYDAMMKKTVRESEKCIDCENLLLCGGGCIYDGCREGPDQYAKAVDCGVLASDGDEYLRRLTLFLSRTTRKDYFADL